MLALGRLRQGAPGGLTAGTHGWSPARHAARDSQQAAKQARQAITGRWWCAQASRHRCSPSGWRAWCHRCARPCCGCRAGTRVMSSKARMSHGLSAGPCNASTVFPDVLSCASVGSTLTCHLLHNRKHALLCSLVAAEPLHVLRVPAKDEDLVVHACGLASAKCVVSSVDARPAQQLVVGLGAGEVDG